MCVCGGGGALLVRAWHRRSKGRRYYMSIYILNGGSDQDGTGRARYEGPECYFRDFQRTSPGVLISRLVMQANAPPTQLSK